MSRGCEKRGSRKSEEWRRRESEARNSHGNDESSIIGGSSMRRGDN